MRKERPDTPLDENWVWEDYWQGDRVALCLDADYLEYDEGISSDWKQFFSSLTDGAHVLDICTGNGAVAMLAVQAATEANKTFSVTGVDKANIAPATFVSTNTEILEKITFKGGVDIVDLPFPDARFEGISGQYGLEYTDVQRSLVEIARVTKPAGRVRFLLHAAEGSVLAGANQELERIKAFRTANDIFGAAKKAIEAAIKLKKMPRPSKAFLDRTAKAEARFHAAVEACTGTYEKNDKDFVFGTLSRLENALQAVQHYREDEVKDQFDKIKASLDAHEGRLKSLVNAAVNESDCALIAASLTSLGFEADPVAPGNVQNRQIGWIVSATKA